MIEDIPFIRAAWPDRGKEQGMQYRQYGKDGPAVSVLGFGAMRLPLRDSANDASVDFPRAMAVMRRALKAGVNLFDTHHDYHSGMSEKAIGRALKGWKGPRVCIQTKTPFYDEKPLDHFKRRIEEALQRTGVDCLDYLLFHSMRMDAFRKRGRQFFQLTDWAMKRGLIRAPGFSSHDTAEHVKQFVDTGEFSVMVVSFNWLNPAMADAISYACSRGMGVSVMNPIGGGNLAVGTPVLRRFLPGARSPCDMALRFVLGTPGVTCALSGMNNLRHVAENARTADLARPMTPVERNAMLRRIVKVNARARRFCTGCGYCMPCPAGVNIPANFRLMNLARFFGLVAFARSRFKRLRNRREGDRSALACKACGKCLPKCPNRIPISRQMGQTSAFLAEDRTF